MTSDERVVELEVKYAHLERTVSELNEVLYRQQRELDALKETLRRLQDKSEPGLVDASAQEKPPHY